MRIEGSRPQAPGDPVRPCGDCTLCCKLISVRAPEVGLDKPGGVWCRHCPGGTGGCAIHAGRPESCRQYQCLWTTSPDLDEALRPNRCRAVMEMSDDGRTLLVLVDPGRPDTIRRQPLRSFLDGMTRHGVAILILDHRREPRLMLPKGRSEAEVWASLEATCQRMMAAEAGA